MATLSELAERYIADRRARPGEAATRVFSAGDERQATFEALETFGGQRFAVLRCGGERVVKPVDAREVGRLSGLPAGARVGLMTDGGLGPRGRSR